MRIEQHRKTIRSPEDMSLAALVVLALWESGVVGAEAIAGVLRTFFMGQLPYTTDDEVEQLADALYACRNPVVRTCVRHGLPHSIRVALPADAKVRCGLCRGAIAEIPCLRCRLDANPPPGRPARERRDEPPPAEFPTDAAPGSLRKIAVMRRRADLGWAVLHPGDAAGCFD